MIYPTFMSQARTLPLQFRHCGRLEGGGGAGRPPELVYERRFGATKEQG